jgi:ABC-type nitrate/sulfonate/bicarbonate transport system substrate-binding protein
VRFSYVSNASQAYVPLIMKAKGLDKKYGLDVQTNEVSAPPQQWLALRAGSGDISAGNVVDLFRERKAGMKARAVRGFTGWGNEIVTVPSKPYSKLADLKGARFGTFSTTLMDWLVVRTAGKKAENIDLQTDAKIVNAAPALLNEQLFKDQIDAALQFAPDLTEGPEVEGRMKRITSVHDLLQEAGFDPDSFYLTWNLLDSWGQKNPGAAPKLVAAMDEAVNALETDDSVWPDLAKRSGVTDPKLLPDFIKLQRESFKTNFGEAKLKPTQDLFDAIAKSLGTDALGQQNVDPAAFDFQSIVAAKALEKQP